MKKLQLFFTVILLAHFSFNAYNQSLRGNGNVTEQEHDVSDFVNINVRDGVDLFITQGDKIKVVVKSDENLHDLIKTEVSDNTLRIFIEGNIRGAKYLDVYITVIDLESLKVSDGSDVKTLSLLKLDNLSVECNDGSDIDLKLEAKQFACELSDGSDADIEGVISKISFDADDGSDIEAEIICDELVCELNEGSDIDLKGVAKYVNIKAKQGSDISAFNLKVEDFSLKLYEGSDAYIFVTKNLDITATGGSDVSVKGNPANRNINVDDGSDLSFK